MQRQIPVNSNQRHGLSRRRGTIGVVLAVYWVALFVGTHIPNPQGILPPEVSDKTLHLTAYCGLALLFTLWVSTKRALGPKRCLLILLGLAAYGAADELLQMVPIINRHADALDWVADVIGVILGLVIVLCLRGLLSWFWPRHDG